MGNTGYDILIALIVGLPAIISAVSSLVNGRSIRQINGSVQRSSDHAEAALLAVRDFSEKRELEPLPAEKTRPSPTGGSPSGHLLRRKTIPAGPKKNRGARGAR